MVSPVLRERVGGQELHAAAGGDGPQRGTADAARADDGGQHGVPRVRGGIVSGARRCNHHPVAARAESATQSRGRVVGVRALAAVDCCVAGALADDDALGGGGGAVCG